MQAGSQPSRKPCLGKWSNYSIRNFALAVGLILPLVSVPSFAQSYSYRRAITIDHTKIPNTDQTNFPVLISGTYSYLATVANGGKVQNANGFDIIFTSDVAGNTKLDHEIESYSPATGAINFWVRIPALSHTTDTVIYLQYGNSTIVTSQENKSGVWSNSFVSVQHLAGNSNDSLGLNNGTDTSMSYGTTAGMIGQGGSFSGSGYISDGTSTAFALTPGSMTFSAWVNGTSFANTYSAVESRDNSSQNFHHALLVKSSGKLAVYLTSVNYDGTGSHTLSTGTWYHVAYSYDGSTLTGYVNGALDGSGSGPGQGGVSNETEWLGNSFFSGRIFNGKMDEVRFANVARSADWLATEYNNQNSPSTFYGLGLENTVSISISPNSGALYAGQTQQFTANVINAINPSVTWSVTPSGIGSINSTGLYTAPASIATQQTVTVTATSVADNTKSASATVTLYPPIVVSIAPTTAGLTLSQKQQFTANVVNTSNTAVTWSSSPAGVGSLDGTGLYTAPSVISAQQTITVTATSVADGSKAASATVTLSPESSVYGFRRAITIDHTKIPNSDQSNFPVLISGTYSYLATVANGGKVQSANGYDIIFTNDAVGSTKLDHEIESYNASTGAISFWVRVPTLSHTADTVIYVQYGSTAVTTSQENRTSVWDSNYQMVLHLGESASPYKDSTSNAFSSNSGVSPALAPGKIGQGQSFDGTSQYIGYSQAQSPNPAGSITLETWIKTSDTTSKGMLGKWGSDGSTNADQSYLLYYNAGRPHGLLNSTDSTDVDLAGTAAINDSNWHHVVVTALPVGNIYIYTDGIQSGFLNNAHALLATTIDRFTVGPTSGSLDEVRISNSVRSADWIAAEYNNQNSPSTFYSLGLENTVGIAISPATAILLAGQTQQFTATVTNSPNTSANWSIAPAGIGSIDGSGLYTAPATIATPQTVTVTATSGADGTKTASATLTLSAAPAIASLTPASGSVGTTVVVSGSNFSATQGSGTVTFNGTAAVASLWSNTSITVAVPSGATNGNVVVTAQGLASNASPFAVTAGPIISGLTPASGAVGSTVTISGLGLALTQGSPTVVFNGTAASVISFSATSISVIVPAGATSGSVVVTVGGTPSNGVSFTVTSLPNISGLTPGSGAVGSSVTIAGSNFGATQGSGNVTFNGVAASVSSWSNASIVVGVPVGATTGNVVVTAAGGSISNGVSFTVTSANPNVLTGPVTYTYDQLGRLATVVAATGDSVTYNYDALGNILSITRSTTAKPTITSLNPQSGTVGTQVTVTGTNFTATAAQDLVQFGGISATITSATTTQLVVTVPAGATTGLVSVISPAGSASSSSPFVVSNGDLPRIDSFTPAIATVGSSVSIAGGNFNLNSQYDKVSVSGVSAAAPTAVTSTSMTVIVPAAGSGPISLTTPAGTASSASDLIIPPSGYSAGQVVFTSRITLSTGGTPVTVPISSQGIGMVLFTGTANHSLSMSVRSNTFGTSCILQLYRPDNTATGPAYPCAGSNYLDAQALPVSGTYTLLVDPKGATGAIALTLYDSNNIVGPVPTDGTPFTVTTTTPGQKARLPFTPPASVNQQQITLLVDNDTYPMYNGLEGLTIQVLAPLQNVAPGVAPGGVVTTFVPTPESSPISFMDDMRYCFNGVVSPPCPDVQYFAVPAAGTSTLLISPTGPVTGQVRVRLFAFSDQNVATTLGNANTPAIPISLTSPGQNARITFPVDTTTQQKLTFGFSNGNFGGMTGQFPGGIHMMVMDPSGHVMGGGPFNGPIFSYAPGATSGFANFNSTGSDLGFPASGMYTLWVDGVNDTTGSLNLNVYDATTINLTVAADGSSHAIPTNAPGQNTNLNFPVTQGQRIFGVLTNVTGYPTSGPGNLVQLADPAAQTYPGSQVGSSIFLSAADSTPRVMGSSGTAQIRIRPLGADTGSATVQVYTVPPDVSGTMTVGGGPVTVTTTTPGQKAGLAFPFTGSGNHNVTVTMTNGTYPAGGCNLTIILSTGPAWTQTVDCSGAANSWTFSLFAPGNYVLAIDPQLAAVGSATFAITLQ